MRKWKTKLFANDRLNFYAWLFTALLNVGASSFLVAKAITSHGAMRSDTSLILLAIYNILATHLLIAVQRYIAPIARKLDDDEDRQQQAIPQPPEDVPAPIRLVR